MVNHTKKILPIIGTCVLFLVLLLILGGGNLEFGDRTLFTLLNPGQGNPTIFDDFFTLISAWGPVSWGPMGAYGIGIYAGIGILIILFISSFKVKSLRSFRYMLLIIIFAVIIGYVGFDLILKYLVGRERPYLDPSLLSNTFDLFVDPSSIFIGPGFPSAHATVGSIIATAFILYFRQYWIKILALIYGVLICYSRIYIGVHYPSDVFVGGMIGVFCVLIPYLIFRKYFTKKDKLVSAIMGKIEKDAGTYDVQ